MGGNVECVIVLLWYGLLLLLFFVLLNKMRVGDVVVIVNSWITWQQVAFFQVPNTQQTVLCDQNGQISTTGTQPPDVMATTLASSGQVFQTLQHTLPRPAKSPFDDHAM